MKLTKRKDGRFCTSKTINGKRVFFYSSELTEKKASKDIENQMISYQINIKKGKTFQDVADEWEEWHYPEISPTTAERYSQYISKITSKMQKKYIREITLGDLSYILVEMSSQGYSSKTIRDCASVMRLIFKYAVMKSYIEYSENPTLLLSPPKGKPAVTRQPLTPTEIAAINKHRDNEIGRLMFFCLYTGLRKGEALALQWSDIDWKNRIINVNKSMYYVGNNPQIKTTKTKAGTRKVMLLDVLYDELKNWKRDSIYVFSHQGHTYTTGSLQNKIVKFCKSDNDMKNVTLHRLRHTFCTMLYEFGINVKDAQAIMGHADITTTQNIYTHVRDYKLLGAASVINEKISTSKIYHSAEQ